MKNPDQNSFGEINQGAAAVANERRLAENAARRQKIDSIFKNLKVASDLDDSWGYDTDVAFDLDNSDPDTSIKAKILAGRALQEALNRKDAVDVVLAKETSPTLGEKRGKYIVYVQTRPDGRSRAAGYDR